jgi:hypothetical protein
LKWAAWLAKLPTSINIVWLGPYAEARINLRDPSNFNPDLLHFNTISLSLFTELDARLKQIAVEQHRFRYVSLVDALNFKEWQLVVGDCLTFTDMDHFSACGEKLYGPAIAKALGPT